MNVIGLSCLSVVVLGSTVVSATAQNTPTLNSAVEAICEGQELECISILTGQPGVAQSTPSVVDLSACSENPCSPECPMHTIAKCVGYDELPTNLIECLDDISRCFLVADEEVLPWPWEATRPRIVPWSKQVQLLMED